MRAYNVTVTIGRNVAGVPMPVEDWRRFILEVRQAIDSKPWVDADYVGRWEDVSEDAHVFFAPVEDVEEVRRRVARLGDAYRQEAVGFTAGPAELV